MARLFYLRRIGIKRSKKKEKCRSSTPNSDESGSHTRGAELRLKHNIQAELRLKHNIQAELRLKHNIQVGSIMNGIDIQKSGQLHE